jgi:hypothetical protein
MEKLKLFCFACLAVALLGLTQSGTAMAFDGDDGGFDGGFDGGEFDSGGDEEADGDGAEDDDGAGDNQGEDGGKDRDGRNDAHGHHGYGHPHGHRHDGRGHHPHIIYGWPAFGFGAFGYMPPSYYPYPPGGFRQLVQPPVVHIERKDTSRPSPPSPESQTYWYYCRDPEGYYPDVEECPDGWEQVSSRAQEDKQE